MSLKSTDLEHFVSQLTRHQTRLRGLVRCLLFDAGQAEDVLQDTNVVLLRKAAEFQSGTDFWAWASQVARFQVLTHARQTSRNRIVFDDDMLAILAEEAQVQAELLDKRREALTLCLDQLPSTQRQLLDMRYLMNHSMGQIGAALSRPEGSVRQTLYRIREALLNCIGRRMAAEGTA